MTRISISHGFMMEDPLSSGVKKKEKNMNFNFFGSGKEMTPIEKYFDDMWFTQKASVIQSAFSGELKDDYPDCPFSADQIMEYAKKDDYNLWSAYGETFGKAEKKIDDTVTNISDSVSTGLTVAKYIPIIFIAAYVYSIVKKK